MTDETFWIRPGREEDLPAMEAIYARARAFMAASGNPGQWGTSRPSRMQLEQDIARGHSFLCWQGTELAAVFAFSTDGEPTYGYIEGEGWPDSGDYGVVHRLAASGTRKGAAAFCLNWCRSRCRQIRIDTHEANRPMRDLLAKMGFHPCGVIYVEDGTPRLAYYL